jgi:uncharacterized protein YggU (UPF0235/DUF167 family)
VAVSSVTVSAGGTARLKTLRIVGDPTRLAEAMSILAQ